MTDKKINPPEWLDSFIAAELDKYTGRINVTQIVLAAIARDRQERPPQALRPMETAPRDGSFIIIKHTANQWDENDDAEITFSLCYWNGKNGWYYCQGDELHELRDKNALGWIPQPVTEPLPRRPWAGPDPNTADQVYFDQWLSEQTGFPRKSIPVAFSSALHRLFYRTYEGCDPE